VNRNLVTLTIVVAVLLFSALSARAERREVQVSPAGAELLEAKPPQILTTLFRVTNNGKRRRKFEASVELPAGWKLITREFPFELAPGQTDLRLVSFLVPYSSLAGKYQITYLVRDREFLSVSDLFPVTIIVLPVPRLELRVLQAPDYVVAGEKYSASFLVVNEGNVAISVALTMKSDEDYTASLDADTIELAPGQARTVVATVTTDADIRRKISHKLRVFAVASGVEQIELMAETTSLVEIAPSITGSEDRYHRIPARMKLVGLFEDSDDDRSGFQTEISGGGPLDEDKSKHIDFLFRFPDLDGDSVLGEKDEYRLSLWTDTYRVDLGDRTYSLSSLTERHIYGRGAEGALTLGEYALGAYYMKTRWVDPQEEQIGAYFKFPVTERADMILNYLSKEMDDQDTSSPSSRVPSESDIFSIRGRFEPSENVDIDLEWALGINHGEDVQKHGDAYRLEASSFRDFLSYRLELIHADRDFFGQYNDLDFLSGSVMFRLLKDLKFHSEFRQEEQNQDPGDGSTGAFRERQSRIGFLYRPRAGTNISLDYRRREREDRLSPAEFDDVEDTVGLTWAQQLNKFDISLSGEWGTMEDNLTGDTCDVQAYEIAAHFQPSSNQSYGGFLEYRDDSDFGGNDRHDFTAGVNVSVWITDRTSLFLSARLTDSDSSADRYTADVKLKHRFANEHEVSVWGRNTSLEDSGQDAESSVMVTYTIPFGLPVSRKKNVGRIVGCVYDEDSQQPMRKVVLHLNGATAVTDRNGEFIFPSLKPGGYYLGVDTASIGLDRIPTQRTPMDVAVREGEEVHMKISVTRSARVSGQINVHHPAGQNCALVDEKGNGFIAGDGNHNKQQRKDQDQSAEKEDPGEVEGLANVVIELKMGSETQRRITDSEGRFVFERVRPGQYEIKVLAARVPDHYYIEQDTFNVGVTSGCKKDISIRILPKKRSINMIQQGGMLMEEAI